MGFSQWHVSIHAPVWGATADDVTKRLISAVSIHAPVWGATLVVIAVEPWRSFNPRTRVGCDLLDDDIDYQVQFQSTHPCGVRHQ